MYNHYANLLKRNKWWS